MKLPMMRYCNHEYSTVVPSMLLLFKLHVTLCTQSFSLCSDCLVRSGLCLHKKNFCKETHLEL